MGFGSSGGSRSPATAHDYLLGSSQVGAGTGIGSMNLTFTPQPPPAATSGEAAPVAALKAAPAASSLVQSGVAPAPVKDPVFGFDAPVAVPGGSKNLLGGTS